MIAAAVADCFDRVRFFERFTESCGIDIKYLLSEHSYLLDRSVLSPVKASFVARISSFLATSNKQYFRSLDFFLNGPLKAKLAYAKGAADTLFLLENKNVDMVMIWNGCQAYARGVANICVKKGVSTCFLEIGNFPGKLFVDSEGVNAESRLYRHLESSTSLDIQSTRSHLFETAEEIISHITQRSVPPQKNVVRLAPTILQRVRSDLISSFVSLISNRVDVETFESFSGAEWNQPLPEKYIFVALQVSTDTQMLLNSDVNSMEMLADLGRRFVGENIVVKFHPCDSVKSINHLRAIISKSSNIYINQGATVSLIQGAEKVVTINSTVGLEAILLGKDVEFYGRSLFSKFSQDDAVNYVNHYLANLDYFSNEPITTEQVNEVERCL